MKLKFLFRQMPGPRYVHQKRSESPVRNLLVPINNHLLNRGYNLNAFYVQDGPTRNIDPELWAFYELHRIDK